MKTENETTHTPGPWAQETPGTVDTRIVSIPEAHEGPLWVIADMATCDPEQFAEQSANARLIAAAPELLAALKASHKVCYRNDCASCAAIAKAEGR